MSDRCPHCGEVHHGPDRESAMCPDRERWTHEEKDAWRAQTRRRFPAVHFVGVYERDRLLSAANAKGRA